MVKNTVGGNKAKGFARKNEKPQSNKLRLSECDDEKFAHIIKMFGNGMCQALCEDNVTRTCIIRGKFRGKGKRNSFVTPGSIVLVGTREAWSSDSDKCDLLELYSSNEVEQLKHHPKVPAHFLSMEPLSNSSQNIPIDDSFDFSNSCNTNIVDSSHNSTHDTLSIHNLDFENIDINIDDI
jgi:initiation factor 1A